MLEFCARQFVEIFVTVPEQIFIIKTRDASWCHRNHLPQIIYRDFLD